MKPCFAVLTCSLAVIFSLAAGMFDNAAAQDKEMTRTYGLTASIQGGQGQILVPIWLGDKLTLAPGIGLNYTENVGTTITLLLAPRFYLDMRRVAPYISARGGINLNMPSAGGDTTDGMLGLGFGGEYFVNPKFSFGVEGQLNVTLFDVGGANNKSISTGAAVHANVYF